MPGTPVINCPSCQIVLTPSLIVTSLKIERRYIVSRQQADYVVLALKGNQETLHEAVVAYIDQQLAHDFADLDVRQQTALACKRAAESQFTPLLRSGRAAQFSAR